MKRTMFRMWIICLCILVPAATAAGQADLDRRTSVDVNSAPPADVFGSLARTLGLELAIDPAVNKPVTVRLPDVRVRTALDAICDSIGCRWRMEGKTLRIALGFTRPAWGKDPTALRQRLERLTPADFKFTDAPVSRVLEELSKIADIEITTDEPEASRRVTLDLGGQTVISAIKALNKEGGVAGSVAISVSKSGGSAPAIRIKLCCPKAGGAPLKKAPVR